MRRAYVYRPARITAPIFVFQSRPAAQVLGWSAAQAADWTLQVARNDLAALERRYTYACACLGVANRLRVTHGRKAAQAAAFRLINATRGQMREVRAELAAALANPALTLGQVAA